ncbi:unnamed protein product [Owenia fusiformis]|nr:unnamed protein product [Owenia fusiformis]
MYNTPPARDTYGAQIGHFQQHGQTGSSGDIPTGFNQGLEPPNYIQSQCMYPNNNTTMNPLDMENQMIQLQNISDGELEDLNAHLSGASGMGIPIYPTDVENGNILNNNNNTQNMFPSMGHHTNLPTQAAQLAVGRVTAVKNELRQKVSQRKRKSGDDNFNPIIEVKTEKDADDPSIIEDRLNTEERLRPKFKDPSKLNPDDRDLLLHRRERNKKAALKCREKKRKQVDYLQKEQQKLESENTTLQFEIKNQKVELERLKQQWAEHQLICPLFPEMKQKTQKI